MEASQVGQSSAASGGEVDGTGSTVEIKIKTLDANTYTMRVNRDMPIPALKEELAALVGVAVANQRLICRGKVLKDDQLLSSYNVEDGHTLHLVVRPPQQPSPTATGGTSTAGEDGSGPTDPAMASLQNRSGHVSHSVLMGTINIPDGGEGAMPDLNRIISAVLTSVGLGNGVAGNLGGNNAGSVAAGLLPLGGQQPAASDGHARLDSIAEAGAGGVDQQFEYPLHSDLELQIDAMYGPPTNGGFAGAAGLQPMRFAQPMVIPDALTTMSQYLDRLEQGFAANEGITSTSGGNAPDQMPTPRDGSSEIGPSSSLAAGPPAASGPFPAPAELSPSQIDSAQDLASTAGQQSLSRRLPTPAALGGLVRRVQSLLNGGAGTALSRLAGQLESEPSMVDPATRAEVQAVALRDGSMIQQLGALLLELGRTTQTLRMGQSPAESVVNAGPAVFISPMGPNPMMIQPVAFHMGAMPLGTTQLNGGVLGPAPGATLGPSNIDILIQTSDTGLPSSPSSSPSPSPPQQPASRTLVGITSGAPSLNMRQFFERVEGTNGGQSGSADSGAVRPPGAEENLSMRQLIERAAEYRAQAGAADQAAQGGSGVSGGQMQGAIMTFEDNGAVRVHPVRSRPSAGPGGPQRTVSGTIHTRVASENGGLTLHHPFVARLRDHSSQRPPPLGPPNTADGAAGSAPQEAVGPAQQDHPPVVSQPTFRAQIHVQGLGGPQPDGISFSLGPSSNGEFRVQQVMSQQGPTDARAGGVLQDTSAPSTVSGAGPGSGSGNREPTVGGTHGGVDIVRLIGPFFRHMAEAYSRSSPHQQTEQPGNNQPNLASGNTDREPSAQPERSEPQSSAVDHVEERGIDHPSNNITCEGEGMEVDTDLQHTNGADLPVPSSESAPGVPGAAHIGAGDEPHECLAPHDKNGKASHSEEQGHAAPVGLGLGVLQPLPARPRRRPQSRPHQQVGNGGSVVAGPLSSGGIAQNGSQLDRSVTRLGDQNALDNSLGRLSDLSFLNGGRNQRDVQNGTGRGEIDIMGQLMSNPAFNSVLRGNAANGDNSAAMASGGIAGIMSQLMRSPLVENIVHQVMESMGDEESHHLGEAMASVAREPSRGGEGALDLGGMLQQVIPVVTQMLGGRNPPGLAHQAPGHAATPETGAQGGDSGRDVPAPDGWKEALSQEEAVSWSETLSADVSRQQSMLPQRPFSDVYGRGSPVAKRQKTDLEGTAQKLENGEPPEDILRSMAENTVTLSASNNGSLNGLDASELAQQVAHTEGLADAYMAVLSHDLAARVAADPDFGDGSRFPNAIRVFKESQTLKKPVGERH